MKRNSTIVALACLVLALFSMPVWSQVTTQIGGRILGTDGKPLAEAQVTYTSLTNNRAFKSKTDKNGEFSLVGVPYDQFQVEIQGADGTALFKQKVAVTGDVDTHKFSVDLSKTGPPPMSKEQVDAIKEKNKKAEGENVLIAQYNTAQQAQNWADAETAMKQLVAASPSRWEYAKALADMQQNQGKTDEALDSYNKAIPLAQNAPSDPKADPAKTKAAIGAMLTAQGNLYIKLHKNAEAIESFNKAAAMSPNPGVAYYNICATQYNTGNTDGALEACDKAIAADPTKAEAYFIKGSLLMGQGKMDKDNKFSAPPGTAEALNKYLELAPTGGHVEDVKQMIQFIGAKVENSFKAGKKK
ncbi:MAG TPA: tetratricopeptide repeat protein [Candidatus Angelobacter sp.]|nr:tetratricopeptide repeat protein [Candidatus Angelobacter sp.]